MYSQNNKIASSQNRIWQLDFFRGLAILNMVVYHTLYDLKYVFDAEFMDFFSIDGFYPYQQYICISFIFIAGISAVFSRNILKNAVKLLLLNLLIELVTKQVSEDLTIRFGVLALTGSGLLFICLLCKRVKSHCDIMFAGSLLLFIGLKYTFAVKNQFFLCLNDNFSAYKYGYVLGFPRADFYSADYFPILPWVFLLFSGYFLGKAIMQKSSKKNMSDRFKYKVNKRISGKHKAGIIISAVCLIGRNSLIIYLTHQVVIYGVLYFIFEKI